ncbi:hypothetical protein [Herbaspirillum rubrisubalbicans]|uniref:Uncharacterized protein n=2 Tax=Herbaspirillum rubrisubalbicans TaxID=80842 RepID=A0A6M3ZJ06_9BURK|nr:hypothetical protein [Herbaspirillum rubrisubalbicans]QJP98696.1 hypothetical protein C798_00160 [Herbaspirillum rubrisubalbicans Os34]
MRLVSAALILLALQGCAGSPLSNLVSGQRYQTTSDVTASWVGASEDELVMAWGAPKNSHVMNNGAKIISYDYLWVANSRHSAEWGYVPEYVRCERRFMVERGVITRWYSSGDCPKRPNGAKLIPSSTPIPQPTM